MVVTVEDAPPQLIVKTTSPWMLRTTVSLPVLALLPDQSPDAEQEDALALVQVTTVESPRNTLVGLADIDALAELLGAVSALLPPPPPQLVIAIVTRMSMRLA